MSQSQPLTYTQLITNISVNALNNPNPPETGSTDYLTFTNLINNLAIPSWENERGVLWNELWTDEPNFTTITVGMTSIPLPDDFKFIGGGYVRLTYPSSVNSSAVRPVPVKKLEEIELNPYNNKREFYVSGSIPNGFNLLLGWTPQTGDAEIGATVSFRYYRYAIQLVNPQDVPEMSDPNFITYKVAAAYARNNFNMNLYQINENLANYSLTNMRKANSMASNFMDDYIKDVDYLTNNGNYWPGRRHLDGGYYWS